VQKIRALNSQVKTQVILLNKPYGVLCQFRPLGSRRTLADLIDVPGVYAAGRLDAASEGLLVLTDDGSLQHRITDPRKKLETPGPRGAGAACPCNRRRRHGASPVHRWARKVRPGRLDRQASL